MKRSVLNIIPIKLLKSRVSYTRYQSRVVFLKYDSYNINQDYASYIIATKGSVSNVRLLI